MRDLLFSPDARWSAGLAFVRLVGGLLMARHGLDVFDAKGMAEMGDWLATDLHLPAGSVMAYLAKGSEFFGGLLVAVGLLTRPTALLVVVTMLVAAFGAHGDDVLGKGEHALLFGLLFAVFFFTGPGRWSVDYWLSGRRALKR
mgnify:FL=1